MKNKNIIILLFWAILFSSQLYPQNNIPNSIDSFLSTNNLSGERIFFVKKRLLHNLVVGDIYSMNHSGGDVQKLTTLSDSLYITELPEISRDGTKLCFVSNFQSWKSSFYTDVFMIDFQTATTRRITGFEKTSPTAKTATVNVTVSDPDTFAITPSAIRISHSGCSGFVTGKSATLKIPADEDVWIKAEVAKAKGDLKIINVAENSTESVQLDLRNGSISVESYDVALDNSNVVVSTNSENTDFPFYTLGIWDTKTLQRISEVGNARLGGDITPKYSPNDGMIAYGTGEHTLNSLGVISTTELNSQPTILVPGNRFGIQEFCAQPDWTPNGTEIVYVRNQINGLGLQSNLFKISSNGGDPIQLTYYSGKEVVSKPSYSPDGSKIAFNLLQSNGAEFSWLDLINYNYKSDIYYISQHGGEAVALTNDGASIDPSWGIVSGTVSVEDDSEQMPSRFYLSQNYPNPFNPSTTIKYEIPVQARNENVVYVTLKVYDMLGREIAILVNEEKPTGEYEIVFDNNRHSHGGGNLTSGVYYYRLTCGSFVETKKMLLLK